MAHSSAPASSGTAGGGSRSEFLVNDKYRLIRKIGSGSFGDIYLGINVSNGEVCIICFKSESCLLFQIMFIEVLYLLI